MSALTVLLQLCRYLSEKLLADDVNTRHRTLLIIETCADIPKAVLFRKYLRQHCIDEIAKMVDFEGAAGLTRQSEEEAILHNHALMLLKLIVHQPGDEVEVFVPTGVADILAAMDKDGDGEVDREEFATAMREHQPNITDDEITVCFAQLDADRDGTIEFNGEDGQVQAGGEDTHSGVWERGVVNVVGGTYVTVQIHPSCEEVLAQEALAAELGDSDDKPEPLPVRLIQVPWISQSEEVEGEDPGEKMLLRVRPMEDEALAEEKQEANERAAIARVQREKDERERVQRGEIMNRAAKSMWSKKKGSGSGSPKLPSAPAWDQGTNIDAFIKKHDIRILGGPEEERAEADKAKETAEKALALLGTGGGGDKGSGMLDGGRSAKVRGGAGMRATFGNNPPPSR